MDIQDALTVFDALSQETRLKAFRLLVEFGMEGAPAGVLSEKLGVPHNTLSFHLSHMANAGLITSRKQGRSVIYTVDFCLFQDVLRFMIEDCCTSETASIRDSKSQNCTLIELKNLSDCCKK
ncbi:MAG: transcriptional regulator [Alphaproteobacteria bacterium]|nr:MAG: transcriptional regulator [Alphaproteobacteria bacterium]